MRERLYANLKGDFFRIVLSLIFGIKYTDDKGPDSQSPVELGDLTSLFFCALKSPI